LINILFNKEKQTIVFEKILATMQNAHKAQNMHKTHDAYKTKAVNFQRNKFG
jgi:hypothetical protein